MNICYYTTASGRMPVIDYIKRQAKKERAEEGNRVGGEEDE